MKKDPYTLCLEDCISSLEEDLIKHKKLNGKITAREKMAMAIDLLKVSYFEITNLKYESNIKSN